MQGGCSAYVWRYAGDRETAQDLMQRRFLKLFDSFDEVHLAGRRIFAGLDGTCYGEYRIAVFAEERCDEPVCCLDDVPEAYEEPDAAAVDTIPQKVLMQFVSELPAGYRTVFNLFIFEDKSHKEIARLLGINEKSSASQLVRAKAACGEVKEWMKKNA